MEKYGVNVDSDEKTAGDSSEMSCPECGRTLENTHPPKCPQCGVKPFQRGEDD